MIDTHTHIYVNDFDLDIKDVMARAELIGVTQMILPNINVESIQQMKSLHESFPNKLLMAIGLHPTDVTSDYLDQLEIISQELREGKYIAIGEVGLDYYWDIQFKNQQIDAFRLQLDWAKESELPVIIHSRKAMQETITMVKNSGVKRGVFHSFSGSKEEALQILSLNGDWFLGINGVLTFKNCKLPEVLTSIPLEKIVLETDAPYLTPQPYRGQRNEPAYLQYIVEKLAEIYNVSIEKIDEITTKNAKDLFLL